MLYVELAGEKELFKALIFYRKLGLKPLILSSQSRSIVLLKDFVFGLNKKLSKFFLRLVAGEIEVSEEGPGVPFEPINFKELKASSRDLITIRVDFEELLKASAIARRPILSVSNHLFLWLNGCYVAMSEAKWIEEYVEFDLCELIPRPVRKFSTSAGKVIIPVLRALELSCLVGRKNIYV